MSSAGRPRHRARVVAHASRARDADSPRAGDSVTTLALAVFVDTDFGQLSVTLSETAPTTKQMCRLGKLLAKRL